MKIKIISVGNTSPKWVKDEIVKYISMLDDCFKVELIDIKSNKNKKSIEQKKLQLKSPYTSLVSRGIGESLIPLPKLTVLTCLLF